MIIRVVCCLVFSLFVAITYGQQIVIDIEYQPNSTYRWSQSRVHHMTAEYIGAEDMQETLDQLGIGIYNESVDSSFIQVLMKTTADSGNDLPYTSIIETYNKKYSSTAASNRFRQQPPLETADLKISGVINRFQKMEIDSIVGVDSLIEKNRVFEMMDNIHRSIKYPKDTFNVGVLIEKSEPYKQSGSLAVPAIMETSYLLREIREGLAYLDLSFSIQMGEQIEIDEVPSIMNKEGSGNGHLIYDINEKMVREYEYNLEVKSYRDAMGVGVESTTKTQYRWTIDNLKE